MCKCHSQILVKFSSWKWLEKQGGTVERKNGQEKEGRRAPRTNFPYLTVCLFYYRPLCDCLSYGPFFSLFPFKSSAPFTYHFSNFIYFIYFTYFILTLKEKNLNPIIFIFPHSLLVFDMPLCVSHD